jgi:hypothetical protein
MLLNNKKCYDEACWTCLNKVAISCSTRQSEGGKDLWWVQLTMVNKKRMKGKTKKGGRKALGRVHVLLDTIFHDF